MSGSGYSRVDIKFIKNKKDGGLAEAIDKVKKEDAVKMKRGGMAQVVAPRKMGWLDEEVE